MQPLQPYYIAGSSSGLLEDKKPFLFPDQAYQKLENAYVWRERVKKREGLQFLGRLRRNLVTATLINISSADTTYNIFTGLGLLATQPNAQLELGNVTNITIAIGAPINETLTDITGTGVMTVAPGTAITSATINYANGVLTLVFSGVFGASAATFSGAYFPTLPVMGIREWEQPSINEELDILFDQVYAYQWNGTTFIELPAVTPTIWSGSNSDFFWSCNFQGATPASRLFFATNDVVNAANPMRYYDGTDWTTFTPLITATDSLFQARILIPYYGRLLALNTWEGPTAGGFAGASNFFSRCRFAQIGSPIAVDAWRSDQFGKGGFIDAPTSEAIISATFYKNTLIVGFERSTWQLRYVGEYGLPFLWERISSDFGTESQFSSVLFDQGVLSVGDRAIISSNGVNVDRIDSQIPDIVFDFQNNNQGTKRVHGIRDFQRELVFWCFVDSEITDIDNNAIFPNSVLVYNYRNNTYAIFRDNITCFGYFQSSNSIKWSRTDIFWNDMDIFWNDADNQQQFEFIVCGNQQGFINFYGYVSPDEESLTISAIDLTLTPIQFTVPNHNIPDNGSIVFLSNALFTPTDPGINDQIYLVKPIDSNTLEVFQWSGLNYGAVSSTSISTYIGNGVLAIFPKLDVISKDFNPFTQQGNQLKLSYIDFLTDCTPSAAMTVTVLLDTSSQSGNLIVGNYEIETSPTSFGYITAATTSQTGAITNITQASNAVVTSALHGLSTGQTIFIIGVGGMTEVNNRTFVITVIDPNTFFLNINSTGFTTYTAGGTWFTQCQITSPNYSLETGTLITITQVLGMTQLNNLTYSITVVDDNNFTLDGIDSSGFTTYISNGKWSVQSQQFFNKVSNYQWHRFYATAFGQFLTIEMTYDDILMNDITTHEQTWILNAIALWVRTGGKTIF